MARTAFASFVPSPRRAFSTHRSSRAEGRAVGSRTSSPRHRETGEFRSSRSSAEYVRRATPNKRKITKKLSFVPQIMYPVFRNRIYRHG
jgi:hypothetical protein